MLKVSDIMTRNVIACSPESTVKEAARLMFLNNLTGLPVLSPSGRSPEGGEDALVGIITEADLVKKHERLHIPTMLGFLGSMIYLDNPADGDEVEKQLKDILAAEVKDLMTTEVITISAAAPLGDLVEIFLHKKANPVPVVDENGRMAGIVSRADIVKLIAGEGLDNESGDLIKAE